jgi:hypothetical protein
VNFIYPGPEIYEKLPSRFLMSYNILEINKMKDNLINKNMIVSLKEIKTENILYSIDIDISEKLSYDQKLICVNSSPLVNISSPTQLYLELSIPDITEIMDITIRIYSLALIM